jgi:hypothetical protein
VVGVARCLRRTRVLRIHHGARPAYRALWKRHNRRGTGRGRHHDRCHLDRVIRRPDRGRSIGADPSPTGCHVGPWCSALRDPPRVVRHRRGRSPRRRRGRRDPHPDGAGPHHGHRLRGSRVRLFLSSTWSWTPADSASSQSCPSSASQFGSRPRRSGSSSADLPSRVPQPPRLPPRTPKPRESRPDHKEAAP